MRKVLSFVKELQAAVPDDTGEPYSDGYADALAQVREFIEDLMWERGET